MANNYLQFSTAINLRNDEERTWGRDVVTFLQQVTAEFDEIDHDINDPFDILANLADPDFLGFDIEVDSDGLWIYAEESGTPENVVAVVQAFLKRFDVKGYHAFTWATTCSKMRIDEFSGGAVFITAYGQDWMEAGNWIGEKIIEFTKDRH